MNQAQWEFTEARFYLIGADGPEEGKEAIHGLLTGLIHLADKVDSVDARLQRIEQLLAAR